MRLRQSPTRGFLGALGAILATAVWVVAASFSHRAVLENLALILTQFTLAALVWKFVVRRRDSCPAASCGGR